MPTLHPVPPEPSQAEIEELRAAALTARWIQRRGPYDPQDMDRLRTDDKWIRNFLMHHENNQEIALGMVANTLTFRLENQCNAVTKESVQHDFLETGSLFSHNRDKDGCKMLVFAVRRHQKGTQDMNQLKCYFIYWLERLEREEKGEMITMVFDMTDATMKNMDFKFIQYIVHVFQNIYPWYLNHVLILNLPTLLQTAWKIIKPWVPPTSLQMIKFVDRKTLEQYVAPDQSLVSWGGTDPYEYAFQPEDGSSSPEAPTVPDGDIGDSPKSVGTGDLSEARQKVSMGAKDSQSRLYTLKQPWNSSSIASTAATPPELLVKRCTDPSTNHNLCTTQYDQVLRKQEAIEAQLRSARRTDFFLFVLLVAVLLYLFMISSSTSGVPGHGRDL